jgi:hypothetical protein
MQMDREKRSLGGKSAHLMTLDEVPKFVFELSTQAKSATVSDEEGLDDIMDARQRRRLLRKSHTQSEVGAAGWRSLRCTHAADTPAMSSMCPCRISGSSAATQEQDQHGTESSLISQSRAL